MSVMPDSPELPLALAHVDAVDNRQRTRIMCIYGFSARIRGSDRHGQLSDLYPFGRFSPHIKAGASLLPHPVMSVREVNIELPGDSHGLGPTRMILLATPRGDAALVLDAEMNGEPDIQKVAQVLDVTCLKRDQMRVEGKSVIDWLHAQADPAGLELPTDLSLGPNVHQCVCPGGPLLASIRGGETYWRLVYRIAAPREPTERAGIFQPDALNYKGYVAVGHGRGVSVISGFSRPFENMYALTAIMLTTALGVLHRSRGKLFEVMVEASKSAATSTAAARTEISQLAGQLNELQLDLEFGVESYLDSILIPESIVDAFHRSLSEAMGVRAGLEHSSRMLERLGALIHTRQVALDAAIQEQAERRDRLFSGMLAVGTLLAVPPALLLTSFALTPEERRSVFDLHAHWGAYLLAWLPFIALVLVGWTLRRRIRASSRQLDAFEEVRASSDQ